ncbi:MULTISPECIES: zinc-binding dehydrogenase [Streptomyces]|uniref:Zinc-binding dehydrogenase n=1 Tax=Streptomyces lonegramiae TaxID=3075524 RepID=A0ABU2XH08_9ACTN|nr:zinc-binding dehydrogenase [Streptomyces sp. DSM 41529]MDT0544667.1 zinc-binding dehydrogenase [Streptomyces sp. DSM 41529]
MPEPGRGEVLVKVRATSVNPAEALVRAGKMRMLSGFRFPKGTGQDFTGEVVASGPGGEEHVVGRQVWGTRLGPNSAAAAEATAADLDRLARHVEAGELRAVVDQEYALADIAAAHRAVETGHSRGKRVIRISD